MGGSFPRWAVPSLGIIKKETTVTWETPTSSGFASALRVTAAGFASLAFTLPGPVLWAQDAEKPAIAPAPRTINLTQEQRFIIRENVKDLKLTKAQASATETIGDRVPDNIELHPMPPEIANKVPQAKSHSFFVKDGDNAIVLVSPTDRRVADVIPEAPTK